MIALLGTTSLLTVVSAPAAASVAGDERAGAALLAAVEAGTRDCASLTTADFERISDYAMGRMLGSTDAHESMESLMQRMLGKRSATTAHVVMGRRFARCGGGQADPAFNGMMGMMGAAYSAGAAGVMDGSDGAGPGAMMGRSPFDDDDDWGGAGTAMVVMMGILILVLVGALVAWTLGRAPAPTPLDILRDRLARGEIDQDEFDRRRTALGGTT